MNAPPVPMAVLKGWARAMLLSAIDNMIKDLDSMAWDERRAIERERTRSSCQVPTTTKEVLRDEHHNQIQPG